jgi:uncharacterized membrane protein (UPF0127 family)
MDKRLEIALVVLVIAALVTIWVKVSNKAVSGEVKVRVGAHEFIVEVADTLFKQAQGLSGREALEAGHGMLFIFKTASTQNFWMKDMHFPIDIIWINEGKVIGFAERAPVPTSSIPTFTSNGPADMVLEVPAGTVANEGIKAGDTVEVLR